MKLTTRFFGQLELELKTENRTFKSSGNEMGETFCVCSPMPMCTSNAIQVIIHETFILRDDDRAHKSYTLKPVRPNLSKDPIRIMIFHSKTKMIE